MIATFRVAFVRATFRRGRGEWRVSLRSTRPGMSKTPDYQAFFLAEDDERLDETLTLTRDLHWLNWARAR